MADPKKSSEWAEFQARQRQEYRAANPRSWGWLKAVGVAVVGIGLGCLAYYILGPASR